MRIAEHLAEIHEALSGLGNHSARLWLSPRCVTISRTRRGVVTLTAVTPLCAWILLRDHLTDTLQDWLNARGVNTARVIVKIRNGPWDAKVASAKLREWKDATAPCEVRRHQAAHLAAGAVAAARDAAVGHARPALLQAAS